MPSCNMGGGGGLWLLDSLVENEVSHCLFSVTLMEHMVHNGPCLEAMVKADMEMEVRKG